jgi:hypothetical protein
MLRQSDGSFSKIGSIGCHTEIFGGAIGNDSLDFNDINEGIVYIEGGIGKFDKSNSPQKE